MAHLTIRIDAGSTRQDSQTMRLMVATDELVPARVRVAGLVRRVAVGRSVETPHLNRWVALKPAILSRVAASRSATMSRATTCLHQRVPPISPDFYLNQFGSRRAGDKTSSIPKIRTSRRYRGTTPWVRVTPCPCPAHGETRGAGVTFSPAAAMCRFRPPARARPASRVSDEKVT